ISVYQLMDVRIEVGIFSLRRTFRFLSQSYRRVVLGIRLGKESHLTFYFSGEFLLDMRYRLL
ncbi:hypothetical protein, partial [Vibrio nigripulchritudo]|uniref:hypothetical protein n=1 Tax=Vibrio nigripulchritudo TaxID=28173 RepID=UPI0005FA3368